MAENFQDKEFLEFVIKNVVDHPDQVQVERKVDEMGVLLTLKVHPEDMGQVIGRQGQTARAVRNLVRIVGLKNHARVNLKIEEPEGGRGPNIVGQAVPATGRGAAKLKSTDLDDLKI